MGSLVVAAACILCVAVVTIPSPAAAQIAFLGLDEKCSACKAIVYELERAMRFETPQESIKVGRQVLDSNGKRRQGRTVDYRMSELRAITLVDGLCPTMTHYGKVVNDGESRWMRVNYAEGDVVIDGTMTLGGAKSETEGKALKLYCDKLVEEFEDEFTEATQAGVEALEERLCYNSLALCGEKAVENERVREEAAKAKRPRRKRKKSNLSPEEKLVRDLENKQKEMKRELKRLERIKQEKITQKQKLQEDIVRYKNEVQKVKQNMRRLEEELEEARDEL